MEFAIDEMPGGGRAVTAIPGDGGGIEFPHEIGLVAVERGEWNQGLVGLVADHFAALSSGHEAARIGLNRQKRVKMASVYMVVYI